MLTLTFTAGEAPPAEAGIVREVNVWRDEQGQVLARAYAGPATRWVDWPPFGRFAFGPDSRTVTVWASPEVSRAVIRGHFERVLQPLILQAFGYQTLHASAVRSESGALAFCGERGAGKSTLAYAMRHSGWSQIADDALVLEANAAGTTARPLPFTPRFWDASFDHFRAGAESLPFETTAFEACPVPLRAIFLLQRSSAIEAPCINRVSLMSAFSSLLSHASYFDPDDPSETRRLVVDYLAFSRQVPVFTLAYVSDYAHLPQTIAAIARTAAEIGVAEPEGMSLA